MKTRRFQWTERLNLNPPERLILPISQKFPARFLHVQHLDLLAPLMPWWQLDPPHHLRCRLFTFSRQPSTPRLRPICYIKNAPIFHSKFGNENMTIFFFFGSLSPTSGSLLPEIGIFFFLVTPSTPTEFSPDSGASPYEDIHHTSIARPRSEPPHRSLLGFLK